MKTHKITALLLALLLLTLWPGAAGAKGLEFMKLRNSQPGGDDFVPSVMYIYTDAEIRKMRLPLLRAKDAMFLHPTATDDRYAVSSEGQDFPLRYLGKTGDYYQAMNLEDGSIVYVKQAEAVRITQTVDYARYPAGRYGVSPYLDEGGGAPSLQDPATGIMEENPDYREPTARPANEAYLNEKLYYAKAEKGKTGRIQLCHDGEGKQVIETLTFDEGVLFDPREAGRAGCVIVENATVYDGRLAPAKAVQRYAAENPEAMNPGEGILIDPNIGWASPSILIHIAFH